jgi:hypothetical protein
MAALSTTSQNLKRLVRFPVQRNFSPGPSAA